MSRLLSVALLFLALLSPAAAQLAPPKTPDDPMFSPADEKLLTTYLLDQGKLTRFEAATKALAAKAKDDLELQKELAEDEEKQDGIERWAEIIATQKPKTVAILKSVPVEPREFVLSSYAFMLTMVYADLLKANPLSPLPPYVPRVNLGFVRAHEDRLAALFQALAAEEELSAGPNLKPGPPDVVPEATPGVKSEPKPEVRSEK